MTPDTDAIADEVDRMMKYMLSRKITDGVLISTLATTLLLVAGYASIPMAEITSKLLTAEKLKRIIEGGQVH